MVNILSSNFDSTKIKLQLCCGKILTWNPSDIFSLRKNYRIIGVLIGPFPGQSHQVQENGLPFQLLSEEAQILLEIGVCQLVKYKFTFKNEMTSFYQNYRSNLRQEYFQLMKENREKDVQNFLPSKSKKRKLNVGLGDDKTKMLLSNTFSSSTSSSSSSYSSSPTSPTFSSCSSFNDFSDTILPIQMFVQSKWAEYELVTDDDWKYPSCEEERIKFFVFKDLWNKGFYLTSGFKFGCDYLAYKNDPIKTHADYMVICKTSQEDITAFQLLILGRLSTQVRKKLLIAVVQSQKNEMNETDVMYLVFNWAGNQDSIKLKRIMQKPNKHKNIN